jgi:hypothetical protein
MCHAEIKIKYRICFGHLLKRFNVVHGPRNLLGEGEALAFANLPPFYHVGGSTWKLSE